MSFLNPNEIAFLMRCEVVYRQCGDAIGSGFVDGRPCYSVASRLASQGLVRAVGFGWFKITEAGRKAIPARYWRKNDRRTA